MIPNYTRTRGADIATRGDDWHTHAACSRKPTRDAIDDALAICGGCPVRTQCTTDALRIEQGTRSAERFSIRGGLTPTERANTKKA